MAHAGGRPSLLTPEIIEDVRRLLPTAMYLETVGDYLGLDRTTVRKWIRRGSKEARRLAKPGARTRPTEDIFHQFFLVYKKAIAEGLIYDLGVIKKASAEQWQAAAWRLERRDPEHWGRKERIEHTGGGKGTKPIQIIEIGRADERVPASLGGSPADESAPGTDAGLGE